jgi:hypothetical protein
MTRKKAPGREEARVTKRITGEVTDQPPVTLI